MCDLAISGLELAQDSIQVNVLQDLEVFHLVLQFIDPLALRVLVLLESGLLVVQVLQLPLQFLDQLLVAGKRELGEAQLLLRDLLPLLGLGKLVP